MPRTTKVETPGCPPIRALTFDVLGLIKVVEARDKQGGVPTVVEKWGEPESSRCVLAASTNDSAHDPLLAVARKSGLIEVLSPVSGDLRVSIANSGHADQQSQDENVVGLHIFKRPKLGSSSRFCTLLTCSTGGHANLRSFEVPKAGHDTVSSKPAKAWDVCASGSISFSKVDGNEKYALFGGKGVEVNVWDLDSCVKIWSAKSPAKNSLGIFIPTWFTSATFLSKDDHRKFVAGTNNHQVRLYDLSAQRRPVISFEFRETPIKAVTEDLDGNTIYVGNGSGDLASFDIRTGKLLGCFLGKGAGSIRSMARHPELPVLASCGLDSYLRFWDVNSRQLLSAVFLKQILSNVVFDSHFKDEVEAIVPAKAIDTLDGEIEETLPVKRKKTSKELDQNTKQNSKKRSKKIESDEVDLSEAVVPEEFMDDEVDGSLLVKGKRKSKEHNQTEKLKSKKRTKKIGNDEAVVHEKALDDQVEESLLMKGKKRSKEHDQTKKPKSKKRSKIIESDDVDKSEAVVPAEALDRSKKLKSNKRSKKRESDVVDVSDAVVPKEYLDAEVEESMPVKRKKASKEHDKTKKPRSGKKSKKD